MSATYRIGRYDALNVGTSKRQDRYITMDLLTFIIILLIVAWFFGANIFYIGGGFIHLLLLIALIIIVYRLVTGRRL